MTSYNKNRFPPKVSERATESMTSEGNIAMLPANIINADQRPPLFFPRISMFPEANCFPREQSLNV